MSSSTQISNEVTGDDRINEAIDGGDDVDETLEFRPSVEQEMQATIDYAGERSIEGRLYGQTLEAQERLEAREWEIERTRTRYDRRQDSDREARSETVAATMSCERRRRFEKRAASVDSWRDPDRADPREELSRAELAIVNEQAMRLSETLVGWSRAAIGKRLAERIVDGSDPASAVVGVLDEFQRAPGHVIPIAAVGEVSRREVSIEGTVTTLWEPANAKIAQVGLIEDETGRTKFTIWKASRQTVVRNGERVRFRAAAKSWYDGRCSIALTGWSSIEFPERDQESA